MAYATELEMKLFFRQQLLLRQDLAVMRTQLDQQPDNVEQRNPTATLAGYKQRNVSEGTRFEFAEQDRWIFDISRWGSHFTSVLAQWLQSLTFSTTVDPNDCGITCLELLFIFWLQTQMDVPLRIQGYYQQVSDLDGQSREQFIVNDSIVSSAGAIKHLEFLLHRTVLPNIRGQQIASLYRLGAGCHKLGLTQRPSMPLQSDSMDWVWQFLRQHRQSGTTTFDHMPPLLERPASIFSDAVPPLGDNLEPREAPYVQWRRARRTSAAS